MDFIAKTARFSSLVWRPCGYLHICSAAISLKVDENKLAMY